MDADKIAKQIVEDVERDLNEESKEMQNSNVSSTRSNAEKMDAGEAEVMDAEENSGTDSKSRQKSDTDKYKADKTVSEEKEVGSDVYDDEDESDNTVADTKLVKTGEKDENSDKKDSDLAADTALVNEEDEMGDEEEPEDKYGEDAIKDKIEEHLRSEAAGEAIREHLAIMFKAGGDDQLTEEFTSKAQTIFEAAVNERARSIAGLVAEENTRIIREMKERFESKAQLHEEKLEAQVDEYLTYAVEEWMKENELQVETGLRTEITEAFLSDLHDLFNEHNISVPEEKYDVLEEMSDKVASLESQINESKEKQASLSKQLKEEKRQRIFVESTQDLTLSEREKLQNLSSHVLFENEDSYLSEIKVLKESYFNNTSDSSTETATELNEAKKQEKKPVANDPMMNSLLEGMRNFSEKRE